MSRTWDEMMQTEPIVATIPMEQQQVTFGNAVKTYFIDGPLRRQWRVLERGQQVYATIPISRRKLFRVVEDDPFRVVLPNVNYVVYEVAATGPDLQVMRVQGKKNRART